VALTHRVFIVAGPAGVEVHLDHLPDGIPVLASMVFNLFPVIFLLYTVIVILETIFRDREVTTDSINGALCGYLLLGLTFGHLFCLVESFWPGSFHLTEHVGSVPREVDRQHFLLTYFSLITLTTVGYGDITPQSSPARTLAAVEAMAGQFYVAVIVAALVALKVSAAVQDQRRGGPPGAGLN
jgi:hypothetical protein